MRLALFTALALTAAPVWASSDDAWAQFRTEVDTACRALLQAPGAVVVEVNPFGSERYGAALVTVATEALGTERMICIYDKAAKTAELTAPF